MLRKAWTLRPLCRIKLTMRLTSSALPLRSGLIVLGGLTLCNALFGCVGSCYYRSLLSIYLLVGTILTAAQARPLPASLWLAAASPASTCPHPQLFS